MKFKSFLIQPGYVEDARLGFLCFSHATGFDTVTEAMRDMCECLVDNIHGPPIKITQCCHAGLQNQHSFCPTCGRNLQELTKNHQVDGDEIVHLLDEMLTMTCDDSIDLWEHMEDHGWRITDMPGEETVYVGALNRWLKKWPDGLDGAFIEVEYLSNSNSWSPSFDEPEPRAAEIFGTG